MEFLRTRFINPQQLPLVIEPAEEMSLETLITLLKKEEKPLRQELLRYGGILLRNFPIVDVDAFAAIIDALGLGNFIDYIGGDSPRNKIKGGVYTSTEAPPAIKIPLHNELSFVKHSPKHIYFYCAIAPEKGGETIIGDARKICEAIDPEVKKRFIENGLKYVSCYYDKSKVMELLNKMQRSHKSWHDVFETHDRQEVEEKCRKSEFAYQWNPHGWLKISQTRPATYQHPLTQEEVWFNQVHLYDFNPKLLGLWRYIGAQLFYFRPYTKLHEVFFANGIPIPRRDIYHIMDTLDAQTIAFPWQQNDVLILDNVLAMHGRAPFSGKRRVYAAMTG